MNIQKEFLTAADVAELFGVSKRTISIWLKAGKFPQPLRFNLRNLRWRRSDIESFVNDMVEQSTQECEL